MRSCVDPARLAGPAGQLSACWCVGEWRGLGCGGAGAVRAAVRAGRGDRVAVTDVLGGQVGDLWAVDACDPGRWLSAGHTRDRCERLFPAVGEDFRDQHGDPILRLAQLAG